MLGSPVKDAYIAVVGVAGAGKTTFITTCTGGDKSSHPGHTAEVKDHTFYYNENLRVHLIDTPGLSDVEGKSDAATHIIFDGLNGLLKQGKRLSGILLVHPLGTQEKSSIRPALAKILAFMHICGHLMTFASVTLVESPTPMLYSDVNELPDGHRSGGGILDGDDLFHFLRGHGSRVFSHDDSRSSALDIVKHVLDSDQEALLDIGNEKFKLQGLSHGGSSFGNLAGGDADDLCMKELAEFVDFSSQANDDRKEMLDMYREEIKHLIAEIRVGADRQQELATALQEAVEQGEREYEALTRQIAQHAQDLADKEKTANDAISQAKEAQDELVRVKAALAAEYSENLRECERVLSEEMAKAVDKAASRAKADAQAEFDRIKADLVLKQTTQLQAREQELLAEKEEAVRKEVERVRADLEKDHKAEMDAALDAAERQRSEDATKAKQEIAQREVEFEMNLRKDIAHVVAKLKKEHEDIVLEMQEKMREDHKAQLGKVSDAHKEREEKLRQAVKVLMEKTKQQHDEAMKAMKDEVAYWKKEREGREKQYQKEKEEREERERQYQKDGRTSWWGSKRRLTS